MKYHPWLHDFLQRWFNRPYVGAGGVKPSPRDSRDVPYASLHGKGVPGSPDVVPVLPAAASLVPDAPPVKEQGQHPSCCPHAVTSAMELLARRVENLAGGSRDAVALSRMFVWYGARALEGTEGVDVGCFPRDALKVVNQQGVPEEAEWPYLPELVSVQPGGVVVEHAGARRATAYFAVADLNELKTNIAAGYPVVFAFQVYRSALSNDGILLPPPVGEDFIGAHCVLAVGFDDARGAVRFLNSWGSSWGEGGYGWLPYAYFPGHVYDLWTLRGEDTPELRAAVQGFIVAEQARIDAAAAQLARGAALLNRSG